MALQASVQAAGQTLDGARDFELRKLRQDCLRREAGLSDERVHARWRGVEKTDSVVGAR